MNVDGEGGEESMKMEEKLVFMWGYLPGALPQRTPILSPVVVRQSHSCGNAWKDVCGGGCGFAMAISGNFELNVFGIHNFFFFFNCVVDSWLLAFKFPLKQSELFSGMEVMFSHLFGGLSYELLFLHKKKIL